MNLQNTNQNTQPDYTNTPRYDINTGQPTAYGKSLGLSSPNANIVNTTPVNNIPNASNIGNTKSVVIPPPAQGTSTAANQAIGASQGAILGLAGQNYQNQLDSYNQQKEQTTGLINQYLGKGTEQLQKEQDAGVLQMQALSNSLNNQYLTQSAAYNAQYNDIFNKPGVTREQAAQQISSLQQQHGYDLTNTAIQASIASTNYTNAENIINHQIELKYAPIKDSIDFGMQFLQQNKDLLSEAQTEKFNAQLQVQNQTYTQGVYNDHLIKDTQVQMIKDAAAQGANQKTLDAMGQIMTQGGTIGDVAQASGGYLQQGTYQPVQTGFDPNTGLPIYSGFNTKTGQMQVKNGGNVLGQTGSTDTTILGANGEGYQMGASTTMGAYASATQTQVNNIKATTAKIQTTVGNITDVNSAQLAINSVAKNSPITGQMVMSAAQKYGVDATTIIGVMQAETQCGTDGSKGAKECNWGNVGNTDFNMKIGKTVKMKPQEGVDAIAKNLAQRKVQPNQVDPTQPNAGQELTPQQKASMLVKNAPAFLQPAMMTSVATGATYIDSSKVPESMKIIAQNYSSGTKGLVPILNADQVAIVNGADEAIRNITDIMAPAWNKIAPSGTIGKVGLQVSSLFGKLFDTNKNADIQVFNNNRENLAQQIRALSQSAPKGSLLSTAESALPDLSGYGFHLTNALEGVGIGAAGGAGVGFVAGGIGAIPGAIGGGITGGVTGGFSSNIDSQKIGNEKMQRTLDLLNQTIKTFLPNATPATLKTQATGTPIKAPDGRQIIITD